MVSESMDDNGYSIFRLGGPFTGPDQRLAQDLTVTEVMAFFSFGAGGDPAVLAQYKVVQQYDGREFEAARFIKQYRPTKATELVIQAWLDGARDKQGVVRQQWPTLALALDKLYTEVHGAQA